MHRPWALAFVVAVLGLPSCSSKASPPPPLGTTIGAAGGDFVVGSGVLTLSVPAGALAADTILRVTAGTSTPQVGWTEVSAVVEFLPGDLTFAVPATLILPYAAARISSTVSNSELRVAYRRDPTSAVVTLLPSAANGGSIVVEAAALGTYWAIAPDVVDADTLWPLNDGDTYTFDSGLTLTVTRTATEPNLAPLPVAKITLEFGGRTFGWYLDDRNARLGRLGTFVAPDFQEVFDTSLLLVDTRDRIGLVRPVATTFRGFAPFGQTTVGYRGITAITTTIAARERIGTLLGSFDTIRVPTQMTWNNSDLEQGEEQLEFWFARRVGPVALRLSATGPVLRLVEGTVGGQPVIAL